MKIYQEEAIKDLLQKTVDCMRTVNGILRNADQSPWFSEEVISDTVRVGLSTSPLASTQSFVRRFQRTRQPRPDSAIRSAISVIEGEQKGIGLDEIMSRLEAKNVFLGYSVDKKRSMRSSLYLYVKKGEIVKRGKLYFPAGKAGEAGEEFIVPLCAMSTIRAAISVIEAEPKGLDLDEIMSRLEAKEVDLGCAVDKRRSLGSSLYFYAKKREIMKKRGFYYPAKKRKKTQVKTSPQRTEGVYRGRIQDFNVHNQYVKVENSSDSPQVEFVYGHVTPKDFLEALRSDHSTGPDIDYMELSGENLIEKLQHIYGCWASDPAREYVYHLETFEEPGQNRFHLTKLQVPSLKGMKLACREAKG